jgi:hypothetical protein
MVLSNKHSKEIYWLQSRIRFLEELDKLIGADAGRYETLALASQFQEVENPHDLVERLKENCRSEWPFFRKTGEQQSSDEEKVG